MLVNENTQENEYPQEDLLIVPAKTLREGWNWYKYNDGSGHVQSPDGKEYMHYDLWTNEYMFDDNSHYDLFPLSHYYVDGIEPRKFKPFEFMEEELKRRLKRRAKHVI